MGVASVRRFAKRPSHAYDALTYMYDFPTQHALLTYKFTGKERDTESGLDDFDARYYSSTLGRFVSADWSATPEPVPYANFTDPQSLNLYAYVRNNPLNKIDPNGHGWLSDLGQKFHNGWKYGYFVTNSQLGSALKKDAEIMRKQLHDWGASKNGVSADDALKGKSDQEVANYYWQFRTQYMLGQVRVNASQSQQFLVPALDATGKVHGDLPDHVPDNWTRENLEMARDDLKESIKRREQEQIQLGEEGAHRARIEQERQLLRQIEKKLGGS